MKKRLYKHPRWGWLLTIPHATNALHTTLRFVDFDSARRYLWGYIGSTSIGFPVSFKVHL